MDLQMIALSSLVGLTVFAFVLLKPIVVLCALAIGYLWFAYKIFAFGVTANVLVGGIVSLVLLAKCFMAKVHLNTEEVLVIVLFGCVTAWALVLEIFHTGVISLSFLQYMGRLSISLVVAMAISNLISHEKDLKWLLFVICLAASISAFIGTMQVTIGEPFWSIREAIAPFSSRVGIVDPDTGAITAMRAVGLAQYTIPFSYHLCLVVPLAFSLWKCPALPVRERLFFAVSFFVCAIGLVLSFTRSAILGILVSVVLLSTVFKRKFLYVVLLSLFVVAFVFFLPILPESHRLQSTADKSARGRLVSFCYAIRAVMNNPLGTGRTQYCTEGAGGVSPIFTLPGFSRKAPSPHNQFLNMGAYYGIPGLLMLLIFYYCIFKWLHDYKHRGLSQFLTYVRDGLIGAFVAHLINSLFHNAGPFIGDVFFWFFVGILLVIDKLAKPQHA